MPEEIIIATAPGKVLVQTGTDEQDRPVGYVRFGDGTKGPTQLILSYLVRGYWDVKDD